MDQPWLQHYDPLHNAVLSTIIAAVPVVVLLGSIAVLKIRIHFSALLGLAVALLIALAVYGMPWKAAVATAVFGAAYGLFPIGWIILNLIFLYNLTVQAGLFEVLRGSLSRIAPDPRVQVILIAFSFGAFFEGAAGFGTPVAVTAAILIQLGFKPLSASGLSLIANTAPVAFGALGTPIIALSKVTGLDEFTLSKMVGRQLPFFSLIVPFWVVWAQAGFRGMLGVWPAALTAGVAFAIPQFLVSNFHGPWLVDIIASLCSIGAVVVLLKFWQPRDAWKPANTEEAQQPAASASAADLPPQPETQNQNPETYSPVLIRRAWTPWILLSVLVFLWGVPQTKQFLNGTKSLFATITEIELKGVGFKAITPKLLDQVKLPSKVTSPEFPVAGMHEVVLRAPPVGPANAPPEKAIFAFNWLSATGTGILASAILAGFVMGFSPFELLRTYGRTIFRVRFSLLTI